MQKSAWCRESVPLIAIVALLFTVTPAEPRTPGKAELSHDYVPGELIVKPRSGASLAAIGTLRSRLNAQVKNTFPSIGAELWVVAGMSVDEALARFSADPSVEYAEPNFRIHATGFIPDDPLFESQWALHNTGQTGGLPGADIDAPEAWESTTGEGVVVAVIDGGVDWSHPDLQTSLWINPGEIPGNGIDDDGNWFVDDVRGWDFVENDNDPLEDQGHGTHTSGTIAAGAHNGIGVAGISWSAKVMPLRFLNEFGTGSNADAIRALEYAMRMGASITSNSWGSYSYSEALRDAIEATRDAGLLFVAAAGNRRSDLDVFNYYPAGYDLNNIISVASTNKHDRISVFSNFGATRVDLAAPGTDILSTFPGGGYVMMSGTSMAVPYVAGAAALVWSASPDLNYMEVKEFLMESTDPLPALAGMCVTGGRLNAFNAIGMLDSIPPASVTDLTSSEATSTRITLHWTATGDDSLTGRAASYDIRYSTEPIDESSFDAANPAFSIVPPQPAGGAETLTIQLLDFSTTYYFSIKVLDERGNTSALSNVTTLATLGTPAISLQDDSLSARLYPGGTSIDSIAISNEGEGTLEVWWIGPPSWFSLFPESLSIAAGETAWTTARFDATDLGGGPHDAPFFLASTDPADPWRTLKANLIVLDGPDIDLAAESIDFASLFLGTRADVTVELSNRGVEPLHVTDVATDNADFKANLSPREIPAGSSGLLAITFAPTTPGPVEGILTLTSNDPDEGIISCPLSGIGVPPPVMSVSPPLLADTVFTGNTDVRIVRIANEGESPLEVALNSVPEDSLSFIPIIGPEWLSPGVDSLVIPAGDHVDIEVLFNAAGIPSGEYHAGLSIVGNDPHREEFVVQAGLFVEDAPHLETTDVGLFFGEAPAGAIRHSSTTVKNGGTDTLHITDIGSSNDAFAPAVYSLTIPPGREENLFVSFTPPSAGAFVAALTGTTDDPVTPHLVLPLEGEGTPPPAMSVTPASLSAALSTNGRAGAGLIVENRGLRDLEWELRITSGPELLVDPESGTPLPHPALADLSGITIAFDKTRNQEFEGEWSTIISDLEDRGAELLYNSTFPITETLLNGFDIFWLTDTYVNFAGDEKRAISAWLRRGGSIILEGDNPPASSPTVKVFNSIMNMAGVGIEYMTFESHDAITGGIEPHPATAGVDSIFFLRNHARLSSIVPPALQLIEDGGGFPNSAASAAGAGKVVAMADELFDDEHVLFADNRRFANQVFDWLAVGTWLSAGQIGGTVPPDARDTITVVFDAASLPGGEFNAYIHLICNDPLTPLVTVPAHLFNSAVPDIETAVDHFDFGDVFTGFDRTDTIAVENSGTDTLLITSLVSTHSDFLITDVSPALLPPGSSLAIPILFQPTSPGAASGSLTILCNDPDEQSLEIPLTGRGIVAPMIALTPDSLNVVLLHRGVADREMLIGNPGGSDLEFTVGLEQLSGPSGQFAKPVRHKIGSAAEGILPGAIIDPENDAETVDVLEVRAESSTRLALEIDLRSPFDPANLGGIISLDVDQNASTGVPPRFGNEAQSIGAEFFILCFPIEHGYVTLEDAISGSVVGNFAAVVEPGGITIHIPMDALGDDDGMIDLTGVLGDDFEPLDWFPDSGHGTVLPIPGLSASLSGGTVVPGKSSTSMLTFVTRDLPPGPREYQVILESNDPVHRVVYLPARLQVLGHSTEDWVYPTSLETVAAPGESQTHFLTLNNRAPAPLPFRIEMAEWHSALIFSDDRKSGEAISAKSWSAQAAGARNKDAKSPDSRGAPWLTLTRFSGTIGAGESDSIAIAINPAGLDRGIFMTEVSVRYETPDAPELIIPVKLEVAGLTAGEIDPAIGFDTPPAIAPEALPNPFNPSTTIRYGVPESGRVVIRVFDVTGRLIRTVLNRRQTAGYHQAIWDGLTERGDPAGSGTYFYRIDAPGEAQTRKLILLR